MNIIPFDGSKSLPSYLKKVDPDTLNADLLSHAGGGFPVLSIKGKVFAVVRDGERNVLPNPKDPDSPATALDVVIIKANKNTSKVFYLKGYDKDASEKQKPDCYSSDGITPAADSQNPQAKKCATCPHNQWGTRMTDKGASKGKACSDTVRIAVAPAGQINDAMLLRVPPASIRALGEYGQTLAKRGVGYQMVVTKVAFDMEAESPKLTFKPVGFLDEEAYAQTLEMAESDLVRDIIGASLTQVGQQLAESETRGRAEPEPDAEAKAQTKTVISKAKTVTDDEVEGAVAAATEKPAAKPAAKKAPPAEEPDLDVDLEGISFDD